MPRVRVPHGVARVREQVQADVAHLLTVRLQRGDRRLELPHDRHPMVAQMRLHEDEGLLQFRTYAHRGDLGLAASAALQEMGLRPPPTG